MGMFKNYRIILSALNADLAGFSLGTSVGWSSPVVPKLRDQTDDSPLDYGISTEEEGWIASIIAIGAFFGSLVAGPMASKFGRRWSLLLSLLLMAVSYILLLVAHKMWMIYLARTLQGIAGGFIITTLPVYVGEIATDDCRGGAGSFMTLLVVGGILYVYIIGPYVTYMALQWCCLAVPVVAFATFYFMPDSPYFFATKGRKADGIKSLQFFRGQSADAVEDEMVRIQAEVAESMSNRGSLSDILRTRAYRKALLIICGLLLFQQACGTSAVTMNSQSIFSSAHSTLDPAIATILLALTQLVSNLVTPFVADRTGRRVILLISAIGMAVSLFALGAFFYVQTFGDATNICWIPVPALVAFNITYAFGFGPIPWALLGEMFPSNIKSIASSIAVGICWAMGFAITRWFPELNALGAYYSFWLFGSLCVVAAFFVIFVMFETKGLSLQMIQEKLQQ